MNIVVLQAEGQAFGLVGDEILDTEEIVVKPLGKQLKGISAYSGATIMGDGRVALILDVLGLAQRTQVIAEVLLDIELPEMDGLETVRQLRKIDRHIPIIMFSTLTEHGASATLELLHSGPPTTLLSPAIGIWEKLWKRSLAS